VNPEALFQEALALTQSWCAIASVKGDGDGIALQAATIVDWLKTELRAEIITAATSHGRAPVIHARIDTGAKDTVILYNMYDVMPATAKGWSVDPFVGGIIDMPGIGESFVARGAENNKGPLAGMLCVLKAMLASGNLKVNIEILIEGEEETGSGALRDYLLDGGCPVRQSKAAMFPSFCEYGGGPPRLYLGFSGIAKGEVRVDGGAWGGPKSGIHSSNAPWIASPASRLIEALSHFGRPPTGELARIELDAEASGILDTLAKSFEPADELRFRNTQRFSLEGDAKTLLAHVHSTASINISGLSTVPEHADAIIPSSAKAGFDLRTPPSLDPATYLAAFQRLIEEKALAGVILETYDCYPGHRFSQQSTGVDALITAYGKTSAKPVQIWPWAIGAAPAYAFAGHSQCFLLGGAGRGGNAHGIDEFMTLEGYRRFLSSIEIWLTLVAQETTTSMDPT
jgi:acetylornithine deacetylase/succinyl-diaminopimelate desuccinylase-like protein